MIVRRLISVTNVRDEIRRPLSSLYISEFHDYNRKLRRDYMISPGDNRADR